MSMLCSDGAQLTCSVVVVVVLIIIITIIVVDVAARFMAASIEFRFVNMSNRFVHLLALNVIACSRSIFNVMQLKFYMAQVQLSSE